MIMIMINFDAEILNQGFEDLVTGECILLLYL